METNYLVKRTNFCSQHHVSKANEWKSLWNNFAGNKLQEVWKSFRKTARRLACQDISEPSREIFNSTFYKLWIEGPTWVGMNQPVPVHSGLPPRKQIAVNLSISPQASILHFRKVCSDNSTPGFLENSYAAFTCKILDKYKKVFLLSYTSKDMKKFPRSLISKFFSKISPDLIRE